MLDMMQPVWTAGIDWIGFRTRTRTSTLTQLETPDARSHICSYYNQYGPQRTSFRAVVFPATRSWGGFGGPTASTSSSIMLGPWSFIGHGIWITVGQQAHMVSIGGHLIGTCTPRYYTK